MDFTKETTSTVKELNQEDARAIYDLIKKFGTADRAFKLKGHSNYEPEHFPMVDAMIDKFYSAMLYGASENYTIDKVKNSVDSLLDKDVLFNDLLFGKTWTEFKAGLNEV